MNIGNQYYKSKNNSKLTKKQQMYNNQNEMTNEIEQVSGESTGGYDNSTTTATIPTIKKMTSNNNNDDVNSRSSSPTPSFMSENTGISSVGTTESAYDHIGVLLKGRATYQQQQQQQQQRDESQKNSNTDFDDDSDYSDEEVDHIQELLMRGSVARGPGMMLTEESENIFQPYDSEQESNENSTVDGNNKAILPQIEENDDLLMSALQAPATGSNEENEDEEDHFLCLKDNDDLDSNGDAETQHVQNFGLAAIATQDSMADISQDQEKYFKENVKEDETTLEIGVDDDDIATLVLDDDDDTKLTLDPDIQDEMHDGYNKKFAKLSMIDKIKKDDEREEHDMPYVHKSIFEVGDVNDENNDKRPSVSQMEFLSVSSSSSVSSASSSESQTQNKIVGVAAAAASLDNLDDKNNTVKQSQSEDETPDNSKNGSIISSYDFNKDLETGLITSDINNNNNDDETASALPTAPIKTRNQNIDETAASRRNKKILIALCLTLTILAIVLGIVFGLNAGSDGDGDGDEKDEITETIPPQPPTLAPDEGDILNVKWNSIFTVQDATGASSMSDEGDVLAYVTNDEKLFFYHFDSGLKQESVWSAPPITSVKIPGTDECMVKVKLTDDDGAINVKDNDGSGVWTSRTDIATGLTIESASITQGCNRIVVGVPSNNTTGIDAGMVRVYDVQPKALKPFGDDIFGKEGYRMGDSLSISNTGKILAVGSPFSNAEGENAGQVDIYELNDETNAWNKTYTIFGRGGNELGSSIHVSQDGTRIAIGSPKYSFEDNLECGMVQIIQYNITSTSWELLGNTILGTKQNSHMGNIVTFSGDGARLFVNDDLFNDEAHVQIYQWEDHFNIANNSQTVNATTTTTSWTGIGQIKGVDVVALSASMTGDRVTIGYNDSVYVYEHEFNVTETS